MCNKMLTVTGDAVSHFILVFGTLTAVKRRLQCFSSSYETGYYYVVK